MGLFHDAAGGPFHSVCVRADGAGIIHGSMGPSSTPGAPARRVRRGGDGDGRWRRASGNLRRAPRNCPNRHRAPLQKSPPTELQLRKNRGPTGPNDINPTKKCRKEIFFLEPCDLDISVSYEQLEDLEEDFEDVELELLRQQAKLSKDLYAKREKIVAGIPNFWPLVFEQSPPEIDEYIQPGDSALLMGALKSLSVERFELPNGDPRSLAIKFEFSENEHFENTTLEKKFWWREAKDGWAGLVSEPVDIKWKSADKDLTGGALALVKQVYEDDKAGKAGEETEAKKKLRELLENTGIGGTSFFAFFGFRGRNISAEESVEATKVAQEKRKARKEGKEVEVKEDEDEDDEDDDDEYELEIFPTADDLAVCIAEDLWPGAIKYFIQAQEQDALSDMDFESDDDDEDMEEADGEDKPPQKKRKA
ncbi:NAP family protein [Purpureocillium lavendulum]|uniref:NAP family protein n=1 Tax=Purpureocillium lavendulum TaxID=1247861 RepID=A0AB34FI93_9HYPO|nr:NAP family protein [Purpureocillium lavendulum]